MTMQVLYIKNYIDGYKKISAIKDISFSEWGTLELDNNIFGILSIDIGESIINDWQTYNKYCVNNEETEITETPKEYWYPKNIPEEIK